MRLLLALLPLAALFAAVRIFRRRRWGLPPAALAGAVVWAVLLVVFTEVLSLAAAVRPAPLAVCWAAGLAALALLPAGRGHAEIALPGDTAPPGRFSPLDVAPALVVSGILAVTLLIALAAAPNNWDSMVYHLPRIRHWMLNASVAHFPTHNLHELYFPPLAEWVGLHLEVLTAGDRLANLVQWLSFAGILAGVQATAGELGAGRRGRLFAAVFAATIPMAILQASSTQNDLVVTLWAVCFVLFALRSRRRDGVADTVLAGGALGLLLLTKLTAAVIVAPFLLVWVLSGLRRGPRSGRRRTVLAASLAIAALLYAGHGMRNLRLFHNPIGPAGEAGVERFVNAEPLAAAVVSNLVRNGAVLVAGPWATWNLGVESVTAWIHERLGMRETEAIETFDDRPFELSDRWLHESSAGAPLHLLVVALAAAGCLLRRDLRRRGRLLAYGACLVAGFVLFAAVFRWQSANVRLLLPALVLCAPWVARVAAAGRWRRSALPLTLLLAATAVPPLVANEIRPLLGARSVVVTSRADEMFAGRYWEEVRLRYLLARVRGAGCDRVALTTTDASYEYPVWVLLDGMSPRGPEIRHVRVWNASRPLRHRRSAFTPCAVLRLFGGVREAELHWPQPR